MINDTYFKVNNCVFYYFLHPYNFTKLNERKIEIPLGEFFINNFGFGVTEVGSVMGYYGFNCGEVIDSHDAAEHVKKVNAVYDVDYTNKNVLSISSIQHFKKGEYDNITDTDSIFFLEKILSSAKNYFITWPIGYNSVLDDYAKDKKGLNFFVMKRVSDDNKWEKDILKSFNYQYNSPYPYANAICCVTNLESLL